VVEVGPQVMLSGCSMRGKLGVSCVSVSVRGLRITVEMMIWFNIITNIKIAFFTINLVTA
jgi:hypothetical protein